LSVTTDLDERVTARTGSSRIGTYVKGWLAKPGAVPWIVGLGVLLTASSLSAGLEADDYLHAIVLRNLPLPRPMAGPFDLFRFASGSAQNARDLMNVGSFPWTADPTTRFAFFRPLSAATHILDYALWPHAAWAMHAQNVAWFALALLGLAALYRRIIGPTWVAGLALLLYAVEDTNGPAVGWIANRNSVIALSIGLPVLLLHDRWRRDGWARGAWLAPALLVPALLAGESALAIVGYLVAYTLHLDRGTWRARVAALLPYGAILIVWRTVYTRLGYGVSGSGLYLDPGRHPLEFLTAVPRRLPLLLLGQFGLPRSDFGQMYEYAGPHGLEWMIAFALVVLALLALAMRRVWLRDPVARFFATGLLLCTVPVCAAFMSDRLLLFVGVGAMGLVAKLIESAVSFGERLASAFLIFVHLILAPPLLVIRSRFNDYQMWIDAGDRTIPRTPDVTSKTVVLINPPSDLFFVYTPAVRTVRGEPRPAHLRGLASVVTTVDVTRVDDRTLRVRPEEGFLEREPERMLRSAVRGLPLGSVVAVDGMTVTVSALTPDGRPAEALFRFDEPLEDPSLLWLSWTKDGYAPWVPPALGESAHLPAHDVRRLVLDVEDALTRPR
jgi:hypothetical protein